ncbi:hypothetical protein D3C76_1590890 [compost metagenome]
MGVFQKQGVGVDEQGLLRQFQPFGDGAGLASVVITVFALPGREGLLAQEEGVDRPAHIVLRAIGHDPDAQRLAPFELGEGGEHAELGFAPVHVVVAVDEIKQLLRGFLKGRRQWE